MSPASRFAIVAVIVAALGGGGYLWWRARQTPPVPPPPPPRIAPQPAPRVEPTPPPPPPAPAVRHPVTRAAQPGGPLPPFTDSDPFVKSALIDLLGKKPVASFLDVGSFVRRFVATVNNLGTDSAAADLWPVNRADGRFETQPGAAGTVIAAKNADRYAAFVRFVETVDTERAVALYVRLYPLFQEAYEELGFPGKYFNDRVVEVIDDLLATPAVSAPVKVKLVEVEGAPRPSRGGGLYVFEDPTFETRPSGQKILLRMGPSNAARLKVKLAEVRRLIARGPGTSKPQPR